MNCELIIHRDSFILAHASGYHGRLYANRFFQLSICFLTSAGLVEP